MVSDVYRLLAKEPGENFNGWPVVPVAVKRGLGFLVTYRVQLHSLRN